MGKILRIEYEVPPFRAIYTDSYLDAGMTDDEVRRWFADEEPNATIRKIARVDIDDVEEPERQP